MRTLSPLVYASLIALGLGSAAALSYLSGGQHIVLPLYLPPLVFAGVWFGRRASTLAAVAAAGAWTVALRSSGTMYSAPYMWAMEVLGTGMVFGVVGLLGALLREGRLREISLRRTDLLTGLANRPAFYERAGATLALCKRNMRAISLACIDLDNFMQANDKVGHVKADAMLYAVAQSLTQTLRASDSVARFGGDSFVLLLPEAAPKDIRHVLEKIRQNLIELPALREANVTVTMGAITYTHAPADLEAMVAAAESSLSAAKKAGKDRIHVQTGSSTVF